MYNVEDYSILYNNIVCVIVKVVILLICRKYLYDHIIPLRGKVWTHKTSLTLPHVLKCLYQARKVSSHVLKCLYQARKVSGHVLKCLYQARKVSGHVLKCLYQARKVSSHVLKCLYQARKVSGHVFVS